ncbi:MAG: hypothetical protein NT062_10210, partial [Proteobacteria bacterium]|nr:hypothetical protein [Pseudomonadota bacterium]
MLVALDDHGGAAITADHLGRLRFWPTLDGTQPPRVVHATSQPRALSLEQRADRFVIGVIDVAGGLEVIEIDREARELVRARLPAEPAAVQLVAFDGGLLVRRVDQSLLWVDAHHVVRGPLLPPPGARVRGLAARGGAALAVLELDEGPTTTLRWIAPGLLRWGDPLVLPVQLEAVALAPTRTRLAGVVRGGKAMVVVELEPTPRVIEPDLGGVLGVDVEGATYGFVDAEHLAIAHVGGISWWARATDPWNGHVSPTTQDDFARTAKIVVADHVVVAPFEAMLALVEPTRTQYLGYNQLTDGQLAATAGRATVTVRRHVLWLDRALAPSRATTKADETNPLSLVLDDRHLLTVVADPADSTGERATFRVRDVEAHAEVELGEYSTSVGSSYDADARVLAISTGTQVDRYVIEATGTIRKVRALAVRNGGTVYPRDPTRTGGVAAVAIGVDDDGAIWIDTFREPHVRDAGPPLAASARVRIQGQILGGARRAVV